MMGRKHREQTNFFYEFRLDDMIPKGHLLRRINVFVTGLRNRVRRLALKILPETITRPIINAGAARYRRND
jgi:hypothetical protein